MAFNLEQYGIDVATIYRNTSVPKLYEIGLQKEKGTAISDAGALLVYSGKKTGRSPKDKRVVRHPDSENNIDWGPINIELDERIFMINRERAIDYLNVCEHLFVVDAFAGWDKGYRIKVRVICTRAYHALFMQNMLIMPTAAELAEFGEPDYVIFNGGHFPANRYTTKMTSKTSIDVHLEKREIVILGTEYAGEMKKGIFSVMNYLMPLQNVLPMHCSANVGEAGDVSILFGLSGTGKTTLSADPKRRLIGDDEHCWTDTGVFNIEGGCYAKAIHLSAENEPDIYNAIRFGSILENVVYDEQTRAVDYDDVSITQNTRASYPIHYIENTQIPCVAGHPGHIIFLTCDAFGVFPPVSKLTPEQASYHFISGYTAKVAGTEMGITEPQATFSACFGAAFMMWHPNKYAELLAQKLKEHQATAWLVNTGWTGGGYGTGSRIKLKYTRAIIDAIHQGAFEDAAWIRDEHFGFQVPTSCPGVPAELLWPKTTWDDPEAYDRVKEQLIGLFQENFEQFKSNVNANILAAGPKQKAEV
ncbi:phosphoenolpyruvate carboxykinase (ATP) [Flavilitoribacter nigricans]|uniref:Phosphoenolpyruvate carboxykinase (ATP) n=1 Tax=Flavilitoribacter nigricans (strain ATCC 23147 / DSM 23189 / NBRC 102662 / NCIMB 1420 / SS-2) TaxID=1122177 RepID=A0A2D0NH97_FLAN2|nr:phosphoenolpyruvate carboxykinase (ATP) [Flavilitoribacter nigricans]PHN07549.1 phosphoenolpyruvate carboxykinase (ATP) [Flavilitoribacter nigricans DSM 23189 = NBRC 102662]